MLVSRDLSPILCGRAQSDRCQRSGCYCLVRIRGAFVLHGLRIVLRDLGSANGTFVGEKRVTGQRELEEGMEFRLGQSTFLLLVNEP